MLLFNKRRHFSLKNVSAILLLTIPFFTDSSLLATTVQTIQGHPPKLNATFEAEITEQKLSLLGIELSETQYYSGSTITVNTPESTKFNELTPIIKELSSGDAIDSDGDDTFSLSPLSTDSLTIEIRDSANTLISVADTDKSLCDLFSSNPYPFTLNVIGDLKLTTQYGDPHEQNYSATQGVNIKPKSPDISLNIIGSCYAVPNLNFDFSGADESVWDPDKGFKLQSRTIPSKNFPTTGFNNAFFEIKTMGIDAQTLAFSSPISQGSVTATVIPTSANTIKVTLSGPDSHSPSPFIAPGIITIKDATNTISYSFNITKWFIANPDVAANFVAAKNYCDTLADGNYQLPTNDQYTNSSLAGGASLDNYYVRAIGQGILPEWGALYYEGNQYPNTDWNITSAPFPTYKSYWSADSYSTNRQYDIGVSGGAVGNNDISATNFYVACVNK